MNSQLPPSAADARPTLRGRPDSAYIRNPVAGREMLTPLEALDAISILSATLIADERYRAALAARVVPNGE